MVDTKNTTTIRVTNEFKARLALHGRFGERFEDILLRLLPKEFMESATGDRPTKVYSKDDVDSRKTKAKRRVGNTTSRSHKTGGKKNEKRRKNTRED